MNDEDLIHSIKAGTLAFTQENLELVQDAWSESIVWDNAFKQSGLDDLPDPEGLGQYQQIFEDWLIEAFIPECGAEEARRRFHLVRDFILEAEQSR